jgi:outer membrane biosynthesis protein TonB
MAHERTKGWLASLAIHGGLACALLMFSGIRAPEEEPPTPTASLVLNLDGDGSPAPGSGGDAAIPKGREDANPEDALTELDNEIRRQQDALKRLEEQNRLDEEQRRAEEEKRKRDAQKPEVTPPKPVPEKPVPEPKPDKPDKPKPDKAKPDKPTPPASPEKPEVVSLRDILAKKRAEQARLAGQVPHAKPAKDNAPKRGPGKKPGVDVGRIISSTGPLGVAGGTGPGGNPNGGGPVVADYIGRLKMFIQAQWQLQLDTRGNGRLPAGMTGKFRLKISLHGTISFGGWESNPRNPLFESLLVNALSAVGRSAGKPPPGTPTEHIFEISVDSR